MSPHQLPATHDALIVSVAAWEIECCAPPPVVGEPTEWRLQFNLIDEPAKYWLPSAVTNLTWSVEPWPDPDGPHRRLTRGGIIALLAADDGGPPLPEPGRHLLCGTLSGTRHGGGDEDGFSMTTAVVERLDVISARYVNDGDGYRGPQAGSGRLEPTARSPRWFARDDDVRGGGRRMDVGLLMRLT